MSIRVIILGGTGQVGAAVVSALLGQASYSEIIMLNRRTAATAPDKRVRQMVMDTAGAHFSADVSALVRNAAASGDAVFGASCVGVGKGSMNWTEEQLKALEVGVVGGFARGCLAGGVRNFALLSAAGSSVTSRIRYARIMGLKEEAVAAVGFGRLAIFRPGIIAGNAHTPGYAAWLGRLIPGAFGTINQVDIGRAFAWEFSSNSGATGVVYLENAAMKRMSRELQ